MFPSGAGKYVHVCVHVRVSWCLSLSLSHSLSLSLSLPPHTHLRDKHLFSFHSQEDDIRSLEIQPIQPGDNSAFHVLTSSFDQSSMLWRIDLGGVEDNDVQVDHHWPPPLLFLYLPSPFLSSPRLFLHSLRT